MQEREQDLGAGQESTQSSSDEEKGERFIGKMSEQMDDMQLHGGHKREQLRDEADQILRGETNQGPDQPQRS